MRKTYSLNFAWGFIPNVDANCIVEGISEKDMQIVDIPHTNLEIPYNNFNEEIYQFTSLYKKEIFLDETFLHKKVILSFQGVANWAKVYINKKQVMDHMGGYTPFSKDIQENLIIPGNNIIEVLVDASENKDIPPFGHVVDFLTYGGIYREVFLETRDELSIEDIFIKTGDVLTNKKTVEIDTTLTKDAAGKISYEIIDQNGNSCIKEAFKINKASFSHYLHLEQEVFLWDTDHPILYTLKISLFDENNNLKDETIENFGFRQAEFKKDGFYLNGKRVKLLGLNRHQSYPYVGYAMPKSMQERDAHILKNELGVNLVRTSHYPQSIHFLNACDELGLLVFEEIPGWQHIGEDAFKENTLKNVESMIKRDRNHPSIILWGVRINESNDCDELYEKTNQLARELDPTRQTGGVRNFEKSNLYEDVYTYNDFSHRGDNKGLLNPKKVLPKEAPYLVTEHNGHMFPTKSFDNEKHRLSHGLRHASVIESMMANDQISGSIGWVMCDYNTHKDFGSGDRICYHGVMDMFRQKKLASYVYASQKLQKPVLHISSSMDIGEHPAGYVGNVYGFTNCDSIKLYKNKVFIKEFFKDQVEFSHMENPPILIDDFVGELLEKNEGFSRKDSEVVKQILKAGSKYGLDLPVFIKLKMIYIMVKYKLKLDDAFALFGKYVAAWGEKESIYTFVGIKDQQEVIEVEKSALKKASLIVKPSKEKLTIGDTYDVLQVSLQAQSQNGSILYYSSEPIIIEVSGPIDLVGPSITCLIGGQSAFYIKSKNETGLGKIMIKSSNLGEKEITIKIERDEKLVL